MDKTVSIKIPEETYQNVVALTKVMNLSLREYLSSVVNADIARRYDKKICHRCKNLCNETKPVEIFGITRELCNKCELHAQGQF